MIQRLSKLFNALRNGRAPGVFVGSWSRGPRLTTLLAGQILVLLIAASCTRLGTPVGWSGGAVADETLYVGTQEGEIRAVAVGASADSEFRTKWTQPLGADEEIVAVYGTPAISGETLYVGGYDGRLYSVSLADGEIGWQEKVGAGGGPIVASPVVSGDLVLVGSSDGHLYALERTDGFEIWRFETKNKVWSTPAVADGTAFVGSLDQHLYAVNIEEGTEKWRFRAKAAIAASPVVANGRVHFGAFDSVFYAIDIESGREAWRFDGASSWFWARPVATDDTIYVPSLDGNLYALDIDDGNIRWLFPTGSPIVGSPVIVGGALAIPSKDNGVFLLRLRDGELQDQCVVDGALRASLAAHDNVIYLSDDGHAIRSLEVNRDSNLIEGWELLTNEAENEFSRWRCG